MVEISQDEREKIREEEKRKILKELKKKKENHVSYSSHDSYKSLSEELSDYYRGRHRSHPRPHSHRREKERKPQEANINLSYFHGKDNVGAYLDWEMKVEKLFAFAIIQVRKGRFPWLPIASKGMPYIGGLPLLGKKDS